MNNIRVNQKRNKSMPINTSEAFKSVKFVYNQEDQEFSLDFEYHHTPEFGPTITIHNLAGGPLSLPANAYFDTVEYLRSEAGLFMGIPQQPQSQPVHQPHHTQQPHYPPAAVGGIAPTRRVVGHSSIVAPSPEPMQAVHPYSPHAQAYPTGPQGNQPNQYQPAPQQQPQHPQHYGTQASVVASGGVEPDVKVDGRHIVRSDEDDSDLSGMTREAARAKMARHKPDPKKRIAKRRAEVE
jgi:hypothetical protein